MTQASPTMGDTTCDESRPARAELVLLLLIVLGGFVLRLAHPSRMSVEHFDEGVYASNIASDDPYDYRYPDRHLYAPPLLPWLVEWSIVFFGPSHLGTMLVGVLSGGLTVALLWWVARRWFGMEAGLAAATLAALSDFHLLYSRTVLTDTLLCFWLLLAVYLVWESYRNRQLGWTLAAGIATGLAWCTKYNGWLPLAIGLAGLVPWTVLNKSKGFPAGRLFLCWFWIAVTACIVWSPVWIGLQSRGGYSAVAANQRDYLVGLTGWIDSFLQQVGNHRHFDGWLSCASLGLAIVLPGLAIVVTHDRFTWNGTPTEQSPSSKQHSKEKSLTQKLQDSHKRQEGIGGSEWLGIANAAVLLPACALFLGSSVTLAVLAVAGIALHLWPMLPISARLQLKHPAKDADFGNALACWLLAAWFCGLLVATPFYRPFPRLTLPWLMSAWLGAAAAIGWWMRPLRQPPRAQSSTTITTSRPRLRSLVATAVCLVVSASAFVWSADRISSKGVPGWQDRTGLETIAGRVVQDASRAAAKERRRDLLPIDFVIYVYGEPGLFFHLSEKMTSASNAVARPVSNLDFVHPNAPQLPVPTFLVTGPHAHRSEEFKKQWAQYKNKLRQIGTYRYHPSDLVLLNLYHSERLAGPKGPPVEEIHLYLAE